MQGHFTPKKQVLALAIAALFAADLAQAQEAPTATVVVTGTRVANRTTLDTTSPVDVISADTLKTSGTTEINQALAVALISVVGAFGATLALVALSSLPPVDVLLEVTSAFGTVGLSTGITAAFPGGGKLLLVLIMFAGRVGPVTVATALALRTREQRFRYAEERPLLG